MHLQEGHIPTFRGIPIRLQNFASYTAGLPWQIPDVKPHRPVFVWQERATRWSLLNHARLKTQSSSETTPTLIVQTYLTTVNRDYT